jgi:hypothetical protein
MLTKEDKENFISIIHYILTGKADMAHYEAALAMIVYLLEEQKENERMINELAAAHNGMVWTQPGPEVKAEKKRKNDAPPAPRGGA